MEGLVASGVVGLIILLYWIYTVVASTKIKRKFAKLKPLEGRSIDEILRIVGQPGSRTSLSEGCELLQWSESGYHIAVRFTGGRCDKIAHEFSA